MSCWWENGFWHTREARLPPSSGSAGTWKVGAAASSKMSLIYHRMIFMKKGIFHQHHCEDWKAHIDSCCQHGVSSMACINVSGKINVIGWLGVVWKYMSNSFIWERSLCCVLICKGDTSSLKMAQQLWSCAMPIPCCLSNTFVPVVLLRKLFVWLRLCNELHEAARTWRNCNFRRNVYRREILQYLYVYIGMEYLLYSVCKSQLTRMIVYCFINGF